MSNIMQVRRYTDDDLDEVMGWFHSRNIEITPDYLPPTGFIVPGTAAGFIFATDSNWCVFECFIGNKNITREQRQAALRLIVPEMLKEAKEMGYSQVFGFATSQTMIQIGYENEFKYIENCISITRNL